MKFIIAKYAENKENNLKKMLRKVGVYKNFDFFEEKISDTEGFYLTLPFLAEETEDFDFCLKQTKNALSFAKSNFGDFVYCLPKGIVSLGGADGRDTAALFVSLKFSSLTEKMDLSDKKVAVMGMNLKDVRVVVEGICDKINSLSVLCPADNDFLKRAEDIYCETGLDIIFITSVKSPLFMESDVVINCGMDFEGENALKKGALYITLRDKDKLERDDVKEINLSGFCLDGRDLTFAEAECVLCAKNYGYRNFCASRFYEDKLKRAKTTLEEALDGEKPL